MSIKSCDTKTEFKLELIEIPDPCTVPWESMSGDDRIRFCGDCKKNVYNLSNLSQIEASNLLITNEGTVCIRMLKRADGTVVTDECPKILRPLRDGFFYLRTVVSAFLMLLISCLPAYSQEDKTQAKDPRHPLPLVKKTNEKRTVQILQGLPAMQIQEIDLPKTESTKQVLIPADDCGAASTPLVPTKDSRGNFLESLFPNTEIGNSGNFLESMVHPKVISYGPVTVFAIDDLHPLRRADYEPYISDMIRKIKRAWFPPRDSGGLTLDFKIDSDGRIFDLFVCQAAGPAADRAGLNAAYNAGPLRPLPKGGPRVVGVKFRLDYYVFGVDTKL